MLKVITKVIKNEHMTSAIQSGVIKAKQFEFSAFLIRVVLLISLYFYFWLWFDLSH